MCIPCQHFILTKSRAKVFSGPTMEVINSSGQLLVETSNDSGYNPAYKYRANSWWPLFLNVNVRHLLGLGPRLGFWIHDIWRRGEVWWLKWHRLQDEEAKFGLAAEQRNLRYRRRMKCPREV